jgi:hypothetical protein
MKPSLPQRQLPQKFCRCIKKVRKTLKGDRAAKESRAIAICVTSVLQKKRGRTLKKFKCGGKKPLLETQGIGPR